MPSKKSSESKPRGLIHTSVLANVPVLNTTLIEPLIPMREREIRFADMVWSGLTPYFAYKEVYGIPDHVGGPMIFASINSRKPQKLRAGRTHKSGGRRVHHGYGSPEGA